jgi:hypothetical protein
LACNLSWRQYGKGLQCWCPFDGFEGTLVSYLEEPKEPILKPTENYEKNGDVNNVVFPVGAYILDGRL